MKELMMKMIVWFSKLPFIEKISDNEFARGLGVGVIAGIILAALVLLILWLIFRRKSESVIRVNSELGSVTVSSGAIASVIRQAVKSVINCLEISRISLRRRSDAYAITVSAKLDAAKGTVPGLMEILTATIKDQMKTVFGLENISEVKLNIVSCSGKADIPEEESAAAEKAAPAAEETETAEK